LQAFSFLKKAFLSIMIGIFLIKKLWILIFQNWLQVGLEALV
jgi:hypothetical protein